ncbi:hypothetical protein ACN47E_005249 [Coniothyrium glycines]
MAVKGLTDVPIFRLPEELLLHIALQLPDSSRPVHLMRLSLTSRKLRPAAQEALHRVAKLAVSCGCHPRINAVVRLLRTLYDRPDLAAKVKTLRFRTVRQNVKALYEEQDFDLTPLRVRGMLELESMGYSKAHPWCKSLENSIESAFAGLLVLQIPSLSRLDFWVKDHVRGPPSSECITGLFGSMCVPDKVIHAWKGLRHLTTGDSPVLKCGIPFNNLTSLNLKSVSIGTVLRLNGRGSLQGTEHLDSLTLTVSMQFAERALVNKAEVHLGDLFDALDCRKLRNLSMMLINDGYHMDDDTLTYFDSSYFMEQLAIFEHSLTALNITLEGIEDGTELDWLLDSCTVPNPSWKNFKCLTQLVVPQAFFLDMSGREGLENTDPCKWTDLPPKLERLEILYPQQEVESWAYSFLPDTANGRFKLPSFKRLTLTCRDDVGTPLSYFTTDIDEIWLALATHGIETFAGCQTKDISKNLAQAYQEQESSENVEQCDESDSEGQDQDEDGAESDDENDDMPDLIDPLD